MASNPDFPSIGSLAERTDALEETDNGGVTTQTGIEEDRPLQEIESLCMACSEQVFTLAVPKL
jgi:zinc finger protein